MAAIDTTPGIGPNASPPAVKEVHILWITAGLSCDGDSVSTTAATLPSIEDVVHGRDARTCPRCICTTRCWPTRWAMSSCSSSIDAERGELDPFVLVVEGSIPNEKIKPEGYWAAMGTDPNTGQPITTCEWLDRLAPKACGVVACRHVRDLRRHSCHGGQSHRRHGPGGLPRLGFPFQRPVCPSSTCRAVPCSRTT